MLPMCSNSPRKCTPVKQKMRQKASMCYFTTIKEIVIVYYFIKIVFKEDWILKNMYSNYIIFKEHVKIVKNIWLSLKLLSCKLKKHW